MSLSDSAIKNAKPTTKDYSLADRDGLSLFVKHNGTKSWHFRFSLYGKQHRISLGTYPIISLQNARKLCSEAKTQIALGVDPRIERKNKYQQTITEHKNTFASLAERWYQFKLPRLDTTTRGGQARQIRLYLDNDMLPKLGKISLKHISRQDVLSVLRAIEKRGSYDAASRVRSWLNNIFRFGLAEGVIDFNPASDLDIVAHPKPAAKNNPYLKVKELAEFFHLLNNYKIQEYTKCAIKILFLTGVRTGELRYALISEFDFENNLWEIPASKIKQFKAEKNVPSYIVPLSKQAQKQIKKAHAITGRYDLILPGRNNPSQPISENTVNVALKRMGYKDRLTGHGIRATISTALNEQGYNSDWIEAQLSHAGDNKIRKTYNHALCVKQRAQMMQEWADFLDTLGFSN